MSTKEHRTQCREAVRVVCAVTLVTLAGLVGGCGTPSTDTPSAVASHAIGGRISPGPPSIESPSPSVGPAATTGGIGSTVFNATPKAVIETNLDVSELPSFSSAAEARGRLWLASRQGLFRIDPATNVAERIDDRPGSWLVTDGDSLWRIAYGGDVLRRYDARTGQLVASTDVPGPGGLVLREDRIWVTEHNAGGLRQYDPRTLELLKRTQIAPEAADCCGPGTIRTIGETLWIADPKDGRLLAVNASTGEVARTVDLGLAPSDGLTVAEGMLWTRPIEFPGWPPPDPGTVLRIDPTSREVSQVILPAPIREAGLVMEVQGHAWVGGRDQVVRIDGTGREIRRVVFGVSPPFTGNAVEAFHDVWVISEEDPRVVRLSIDGFQP